MCSIANEHEPGQVCHECGELVDRYGNTESCFRNCSFPDCGCDGSRNCMAGEANHASLTLNYEHRTVTNWRSRL